MELMRSLWMLPFIAAVALTAQEAGDDVQGYTDTPRIPGQKWRVHDAERARPRKVAPGPYVREDPPADAIVLFDGKDLSHWRSRTRRTGGTEEPKWKIVDGDLVIVPQSGGLVTKDKFGDCQLHIEFMVPPGLPGRGQSGGNSGVEIMERYEIQVLESYNNVTYADGQAAAIYGQWPPMVNASRPPGEWNVYDIYFEAPRFENNQLVKPAFVTVVHNGILVHHHQQIIGRAVHRAVAKYDVHGPEEPLSLQDHGHPIHYRNIWIRKLTGYDQP